MSHETAAVTTDNTALAPPPPAPALEPPRVPPVRPRPEPASIEPITSPPVNAAAPPHHEELRWLRLNERVARCFWSGLFLVLVFYSGSLHNSWMAVPKMTNQIITFGLLLLCLLLPFGTRASRLFVQMWRAWEAVPPVVLLGAALWLGCLAWSSYVSTIPRLSLEYGGFLAWNLLLCALVYGYAARGLRQCRHVVVGVLTALDLAIVVGFGHYLGEYIWYWAEPNRGTLGPEPPVVPPQFTPDPAYLGHYLALLLPLAFWDASVAYWWLRQSSTDNEWRRVGITMWGGWRILRPALMMGLAVAIAAPANWLAVVCGLPFYFFVLRRIQRSSESPESEIPARTAWISLLRPYAMSLWLGAALAGGALLVQSTWLSAQQQHAKHPHPFAKSEHQVVYSNTLKMAGERPLAGWGPGTFAVNYPQFFDESQHRELALEAHNIVLHRLAEEGALALLFWLAFVLIIGGSGLAALLRRSPHAAPPGAGGETLVMAAHARDGLLVALCSALLMYGVCGLFVMPEMVPTISVHFYTVLALVGALCWGHPAVVSAASTQTLSVPTPVVLTRAALSRRHGLSRWIIAGIMAAALSGVAVHAPWVCRVTYAHWLFDQAVASKSPTRRIALLRQATFLDPDQPIYWAQLGRARYQREGAATARSVASLYHAALQRAPSDGLHWHNVAMLYLMADDYANMIRNGTNAMRRDPTFHLYHRWLATAYGRIGKFHKAVAHRQLALKLSRPPVSRGSSDAYYGTPQLDGRYRRVTMQPGYEEIIIPDSLPRDSNDAPQLRHHRKPKHSKHHRHERSKRHDSR
ncbi:MAG: O-antigen ligase family protein [Armatimonadota bacterium]|nr:O-antigen ligase family protein [Armatimonadota bacterium]